MTHLWPDGQPIHVEANAAGEPLSFTWQGQRHPVESIANRWQLDEDWWRGPIRRSYFKLTTRSGLLVVIFRDGVTGQWLLERLYD